MSESSRRMLISTSPSFSHSLSARHSLSSHVCSPFLSDTHFCGVLILVSFSSWGHEIKRKICPKTVHSLEKMAASGLDGCLAEDLRERNVCVIIIKNNADPCLSCNIGHHPLHYSIKSVSWIPLGSFIRLLLCLNCTAVASFAFRRWHWFVVSIFLLNKKTNK